MRYLPAVFARITCLLALLGMISCKTGEYHYGKASFKLSPGFSRIHSPGAFTAIAQGGNDPEMFSVVWAKHRVNPFTFTPEEWNKEGDAALVSLNSNKGFTRAREISRSNGYSGRFRTMDHVLRGTMNGAGYFSPDVVMSSRLYHSKDEAYFFFLAQFKKAHAADPGRFVRIMDSVQFAE